jgi:hypothetical protein
MGEEAMKITVLGAILVLAAVVIALALIGNLTKQPNQDQKDSG